MLVSCFLVGEGPHSDHLHGKVRKLQMEKIRDRRSVELGGGQVADFELKFRGSKDQLVHGLGGGDGLPSVSGLAHRAG